MTFEFRPLKREDLLSLVNEDLNKHMKPVMDDNVINKFIEDGGFSTSIFYKGDLMLCGGLRPYWLNRAQIWTLFSEKSKKNFLPVFRGIKKYLDYQPFKRVELSVPYGFELGKRRAELLGFKQECERAKCYLPDGQDATLYSYVKDN